VFAILGTAISAFVMGAGVYVLGKLQLTYSLDAKESFAFGSLVSAVDPVATLAIFNALDIDPVLYMLVFGESILNDAVAIVLTKLEIVTIFFIIDFIYFYLLIHITQKKHNNGSVGHVAQSRLHDWLFDRQVLFDVLRLGRHRLPIWYHFSIGKLKKKEREREREENVQK
jgi:hypothetical protein